MLRRSASLTALVAIALAAPASGHGGSALFPSLKAGAGTSRKAQLTERRLRRVESSLLGREHAAAHARQRVLERRLALRRHRRDDAVDVPLAPDNSLQTPDVGGRWETPAAQLPIVAINAVMLRTGKILYFAYPYRPLNYNPDPNHPPNNAEPTYADAYLLDPATGESKQVTPPTDSRTDRPRHIFCAGTSTLPDGRVLVVGGVTGNVRAPNQGLDTIYLFDPVTETWQTGPRMHQGRWYPTQLMLPDGRTVIAGGLPKDDDPDWSKQTNTEVEIYDPATNGVQRLENFKIDNTPGRPKYIGQYPHMWWMPSGHALVAGPRKSDSWLFDPPTPGNDDADWTPLAELPGGHRQWATGALLDGTAAGGSTQAMLFGGADVDERTLNATEDPVSAIASTVRFDDVTGTWSAGPDMNAARAFANGVTLPDGKVAVVGGGTGDNGADWNYRWHYTAAQKRIDLYDPVTNTFTYGNAQAEARTYHSTALLLPDARVLSMGDDINGPNGPGSGTSTDTAETWTPPYLLNADGSPRPRPALTSAPVAVNYGKPFVAGTPDEVTRAVLVAPGADTHANDMSQRIVELPAPVRTDGGVALTAPGSANLAPPGFYMLFLLDASGTPSTARFIQLGADPPPPEPTPTPEPTVAPTVSPTPTPPPAFTLRVSVARTTLRRVRRTGRLKVRVTPNAAARVRLSTRGARRTLVFTGAYRRVATLKLSRKARRRLKGRRRATLVVAARGVPRTGAPRTVTRRVKLR